MPNDDLGQFPSPQSPTIPPVDPTPPAIDSSPNPTVSTSTTTEVFSTSNQNQASSPAPVPAFEETPEEIPSHITDNTPSPTAAPVNPTPPEPEPIPTPPVAATYVSPKGGSAFGSFIGILLLLIAGVAIAAAVFLYSQSQQLKQQILEITQTLERQRTTITPTPSPTIIELSPTPESTPTATPTVSVTPTSGATMSSTFAYPLANAAKALKVALNHQPNAQMIMIKTDDATSRTITTRYFFRENLTTKKYFAVSISGISEPEIIDKTIYVTPDNNIPSLNDAILGHTLGADLDEIIAVTNDICPSGTCKTATIKAQYIKSADTSIWQLTLIPQDTSKQALVIQIDAKTKSILFKSSGF